MIRIIFDTISKFYRIFDKKNKKQFWVIGFNQFFEGVLELVSTAILPIFIMSLSNPAQIKERTIQFTHLSFIADLSDIQFIYAVAILTVLIVIIKNVLSILIVKHRYSFIANLQARFSTEILNILLHKDYGKILKSNTYTTIRNVDYDSVVSVNVGFAAVLNLIAKSIIVLLIVSYLLFYNVVLTIIAGSVLILFSTQILRFFEKKIKEVAIIENTNKKKFIEIVTTSINNIIDVKLLGKQAFFVSSFNKYAKESGSAYAFKSTLGLTYKPLFEIMGTLIIVVLSSLLLSGGKSAAELMGLLALYGVAFMKLIPLTNDTISYISQIKFGKVCFDKAFEIYQLKTNNYEPREMNIEKSDWNNIKVKNLSFSYSDNENTYTIDDINCEIKKGDFIGIAGPTGSGKTTFVNNLIGLLKPNKGGVFLDGIDINNDINSYYSKFAYVPQRIGFIDSTIEENIAFGIYSHQIDSTKVKAAIEAAGLKDFVDSLKDKEKTMIGENANWISGGQRQRLGIARALYFDPAIIILDESTSALDNSTESLVMDSLEKLLGERTIIMIAHRHSTLKKCNSIMYFENGRLIEYETYTDMVTKVKGFEIASFLE